jgi:hypothetical protein
MAFDCDCKGTTAKGFVITISKEEGYRRTKKEYEEFTRHLNHDSSDYAALSALRCSYASQRATKSSTLHSRSETPAAIAGDTRSVRWILMKL